MGPSTFIHNIFSPMCNILSIYSFATEVWNDFSLNTFKSFTYCSSGICQSCVSIALAAATAENNFVYVYECDYLYICVYVFLNPFCAIISRITIKCKDHLTPLSSSCFSRKKNNVEHLNQSLQPEYPVVHFFTKYARVYATTIPFDSLNFVLRFLHCFV